MNKSRRAMPGFAWQLCRDAFDHFLDNCALRLSAALAYFSIISLTPLLIIAISIGSAFFGEEAVRGQLASHLRLYMRASVADGVQALLQSATVEGNGAPAAAVGFATPPIGASRAFAQLKDVT